MTCPKSYSYQESESGFGPRSVQHENSLGALSLARLMGTLSPGRDGDSHPPPSTG